MSSKIVLSLLGVTFISGLCTGVPLPKNENKQEVVWLGNVNGKSYYMANTERWTWYRAKVFADNVNMTLAEITNAEESEFIAKVSPFLLPLDAYWTGGRDSRLQSQFTWDKSETPFDGSHTLHFTTNTGILTCIYLLPTVGSVQSMLVTYDCMNEMSILLQKFE